MYLVRYRAAPSSGLAGPDTADLEQQFAAAIRTLHGFAASIADLKAQYEKTKDPRFLESVKIMLPYFQRAMDNAKAISAKLTNEEMPSSFVLFFADISEWVAETTKDLANAARDTLKQVPNVVKNITSPFVLIALAGAAFMIFGGGRLVQGKR